MAQPYRDDTPYRDAGPQSVERVGAALGPHTVKIRHIEALASRANRKYSSSTVYLPVTVPSQELLASIVVVPGWACSENTVAAWGPFFASQCVTAIRTWDPPICKLRRSLSNLSARVSANPVFASLCQWLLNDDDRHALAVPRLASRPGQCLARCSRSAQGRKRTQRLGARRTPRLGPLCRRGLVYGRGRLPARGIGGPVPQVRHRLLSAPWTRNRPTVLCAATG